MTRRIGREREHDEAQRGDIPKRAISREPGSSFRSLWPYGLVVFCVLGALGLSVELLRIHVQANLDPSAQSFCSINARFDCLNVAESRYAVFAGAPVAAWSILGQVLLLALAIRSALRPSRPGPALLALATLVAVAVSAVMASISAFVLHSTCILCAALAATNLLLALLSWYGLARLARRSSQGIRERILTELRQMPSCPFVWLLGGSAVVAGVALAVLYPPYWRRPLPGGPEGLPHGRDPSGHYWLGAKKPVVVIEEFTDFQCPFCRKGHAIVRKSLRRLADKVRLVHYDFPLDHHCNHNVKRAFHPASCKLARAARCAGAQGKFWEMADALFQRQARRGGPDPFVLARKLGLDVASFRRCMRSKETRQAIQRDILEGDRRHVRGTPTFFVNGRRLRRWPTVEVLERFLEARGP